MQLISTELFKTLGRSRREERFASDTTGRRVPRRSFFVHYIKLRSLPLLSATHIPLSKTGGRGWGIFFFFKGITRGDSRGGGYAFFTRYFYSMRVESNAVKFFFLLFSTTLMTILYRASLPRQRAADLSSWFFFLLSFLLFFCFSPLSPVPSASSAAVCEPVVRLSVPPSPATS